jgi:hypothetical protein
MAAGTVELEAFVRESLLRGQSRVSIRQALIAAGWSDDQTRDVLATYADVDFPVPVPKPRASLSAREAFWYLVLFATLYYTMFHLGSLLFDLINAAFPDPARLRGDDLFDGSMRWSIASVVIAFPVFALVARHLAREIARQPIKRLSPVRHWLTYLTLFLAVVALVCDVTTLVYNLLGGELSVRFVLKVLVVGVLAGSVFGYYLWDLRRGEGGA